MLSSTALYSYKTNNSPARTVPNILFVFVFSQTLALIYIRIKRWILQIQILILHHCKSPLCTNSQTEANVMLIVFIPKMIKSYFVHCPVIITIYLITLCDCCDEKHHHYISFHIDSRCSLTHSTFVLVFVFCQMLKITIWYSSSTSYLTSEQTVVWLVIYHASLVNHTI